MKRPQPLPGTTVNRPELYHSLHNMAWRLASGVFNSKQEAERVEQDLLNRQGYVTQTRVFLTDGCQFAVSYREIAYSDPPTHLGENL